MSRVRLAADWEILRLRMVYLAMLAGFALIAATLWHHQVAHGEEYRRDLMRQSMRRVRLPAVRGLVFDRHGTPLAENRPSYGVALYLEELRPRRRGETTMMRVEETIEELQARLGLPRQLAVDDIRTHVRKRLPLPLVAWRDLNETAVARWAEAASALPGVDLYPEAVRVYPQGRSAGHLLGYVGRADIEPDESEPFHYYLPDMAGRAGIEQCYDGRLRGQAGGRLVRVDVGGFHHGEIGGRDPVPGEDLQLALDLRVQRLAESALGDDAGAVVVLDPANGDVLAMASAPGYDLNAFVPSITGTAWADLMNDPLTPLINRATAAAYAPGSTFKPVVAMAALGRGARTGATHECPGHYLLGRARFNCWDTLGHGTLNLHDAIKHSCNVYFFHLGLAAGPQPIADMARAMGLGARTGLDLRSTEAAGLVPDPDWKRRARRDGWRDGDTCNFSIGQGALMATPVQMAVVASVLANGGTVYRPRILRAVRSPGARTFVEQPPEVVRRLDWNPAHVQAVRAGMRAVVMDEDGTGRRMAVPGVALAGKTGTAEYGPKDAGLKRGWMIAFGPYESPRYAVAMMMERAVSGGLTVAPRLQALFAGLLGAPPRTEEGRG